VPMGEISCAAAQKSAAPRVQLHVARGRLARSFGSLLAPSHWETSFPDEPCPIVVTCNAVLRAMTRGGRPIVVPLDGSQLAEAALPVALDLAGLPRAEVTFLQVILAPDKVIDDGESIPIDQRWESEKYRARRYLDSIRSRPEWQVCDVEVAVEMGKPAETILEFADARQAAYIVMSTHGRSGVERWVFGSVADKVLRAAHTTVVLVRAGRPSNGV
jgi:nucleotide-binding universal stress UspA family protein